jgi:hypothetical protein
MDKQQDEQIEAGKEINVNSRTITLDEPIERGGKDIRKITVRKPGSGELRGVSLMALAEMDVTTLHRVLPRITSPILNELEVQKLAPADLMQFGVAVASFLLKMQSRKEAFQSE